MRKKLKKPVPPEPYDLYMIVKRTSGVNKKAVHAHSTMQAITYYCQVITKEPYHINDFDAILLESPAPIQPASFNKRYKKYLADLARYNNQK